MLRVKVLHVMAEIPKLRDELHGEVLIQLDPHQIAGRPGKGRSSSADAAAKAITARTSSLLRAGKLPRISASVDPSARLANSVRNVTRGPRITGSPPHIGGSLTLRSRQLRAGAPRLRRGHGHPNPPQAFELL